MNYFDIAAAIIICFFAFRGYKNGLVKELCNLVGLVVGVILAVRFSGYIGTLIQENTSIEDKYIPIIAFLIIFVVTTISAILIAKVLTKLLKIISLNWLNKIAGIVFSILKICVVLGGVFHIVLHINNDFMIVDPSIFQSSIAFEYLMKSFEFVFPTIKQISEYANIQHITM